MTVLIFLALNLSRLEAENAALRQQLIVLQRKVRGRVRFSNDDRLFFVPALSLVPVNPQGNADYPARDVDTLAPCRVSRLLALEVSLPGRQAADRHGIAGVGPANEPREPALGCAAHSWRTAQVWSRSRTIDRGQICGQNEQPAQSELAHLHMQSRATDCRHGFVRRANHRI